MLNLVFFTIISKGPVLQSSNKWEFYLHEDHRITFIECNIFAGTDEFQCLLLQRFRVKNSHYDEQASINCVSIVEFT